MSQRKIFSGGQGHTVAFNVLNIGRLNLGASVVGPSKTAIAEAVKYADMREQFGKKISSFGMIKMKPADMSNKDIHGRIACLPYCCCD